MLKQLGIASRCDLCGQRIILFNYGPELRANYKATGLAERLGEKDWACKRCYDEKQRAKCDVTGEIFPASGNMASAFVGTLMQRRMSPYTRYAVTKDALSPAVFAAAKFEYTEILSRITNWVGHSTDERIPRHRPASVLGRIKSRGRFESKLELEEDLKWCAAQKGGNAYVQYYWTRHVDERSEEYVAGHGPNGGEYIRTRRIRDVSFSGHAIAIYAVRTSGANRATEARHESREERIMRARSALGLTGEFDEASLKRAYRKTMSQYHPDKVAGLGSELRQLAERKAKEINEAFEILSAKFR